MSTEELIPGASVAQFEVDIRHDVRIPTTDRDVTLSADLYLPRTLHPVPALLTVTPYRKDMIGAFMSSSNQWFASRGYACLIVDLRGTGSSDGLPRPKLDPGEGDDCVAAIDWLEAQPWCTGDVGMWGLSYGAALTMRAATLSPPQLKAIMPIMCPLDPERDAFHHDGARVDLHQRAWWSGTMIVRQLLPPLDDFGSLPQQRRWQQRLHDAEPFLLDLAREPGDPAWRDRVVDPSTITTPTLCVGGWRDLYAEAMTRAFEEIQGPKRLLMGPWAHTMPQDSPFEAVDFLAIAQRWWDRWLRGSHDGVLEDPPVTLYRMGASPGWRNYECWPPTTATRAYATDGDATLVESASPREPSTGVIGEYIPDATTGTLSGLWGIPMGVFGRALDQHDDDMRALFATSLALADDLLICGRPEALVRVALHQESVERLVVRLADVDPAGRSTFITAGVLCPSQASHEYRIVLRPIAYQLRAGHRLRVVLSDSDFPRLTPLPTPRRIAVAGFVLSLPTAPIDVGEAVELPAVDKPVAARVGTEGRWTITRDILHDGIEVALGSGNPGSHTRDGHFVQTSIDISAIVRRGAPDAALTTGTHTVVVQTRTGEHIVARATVRCTQTALWAHGEVTIDGHPTASRVWERQLRPAGSGDGVVTGGDRP